MSLKGGSRLSRSCSANAIRMVQGTRWLCELKATPLESKTITEYQEADLQMQLGWFKVPDGSMS